MGGIQLVLDILADMKFGSLADVGCGDGRLLSEISTRYPSCSLIGFDFSTNALGFARAFNPGIEFRNIDLTGTIEAGSFDVVTCVETLEHISPQQVQLFLNNIHELLAPSGILIITVPHTNKSISTKHYQHFNSMNLEDLLSGSFSHMRFIPFDSDSRLLRLFFRLIGGNGKYFALTYRPFLDKFFEIYLQRYLYVDESRCLRIGAKCRKN